MLAAAHHDVFELQPPSRPSVPQATVSGDDGFTIAIAEAALEETKDIDGLSMSSDEQIGDLSILRV